VPSSNWQSPCCPTTDTAAQLLPSSRRRRTTRLLGIQQLRTHRPSRTRAPSGSSVRSQITASINHLTMSASL
jgi:hypothetical protein